MQTRRRVRLSTDSEIEAKTKRTRTRIATPSSSLELNSSCVPIGDLEDLVGTAGSLRRGDKQRYRYRHAEQLHTFSTGEQTAVQNALLAWYRKIARTLPWRTPPSTATKLVTIEDQKQLGQRAYEVWVSEIMLQQTQVKTVIDYYERWMTRWPTVQTLADADIEEVNKVWAGLGYYSRARRLHEAAQMLVKSYNGLLPTNVELLEQKVPGIGRYTAGAIASIAYNHRVPLVDGNVQRVLSRLRAISGDIKSAATIALFWQLAGALVEHCEFPGDFNQALMELGATICTPVNPSCQACPLQTRCRAYAEVLAYEKEQKKRPLTTDSADNDSLVDDENACSVCLPGLSNAELFTPSIPQVSFYPCKAPKKAQREELCAVFIVERSISRPSNTKQEQNKSIEYLLVRRPDQGLLAGLWEFPSKELGHPDKQTESVSDKMLTNWLHDFIPDNLLHDPTTWTRHLLGDVTHLFTHIRKTYRVESLQLHGDTFNTDTTTTTMTTKTGRSYRWVDESTLAEEAIPTALKKAYKLLVKYRYEVRITNIDNNKY
ncbi:DNA glycosylase [Syncephalis fuscata]|nr:DNA glycosylase [Syncephalis fuscata]